jgi:hypothetical protein
MMDKMWYKQKTYDISTICSLEMRISRMNPSHLKDFLECWICSLHCQLVRPSYNYDLRSIGCITFLDDTWGISCITIILDFIATTSLVSTEMLQRGNDPFCMESHHKIIDMGLKSMQITKNNYN